MDPFAQQLVQFEQQSFRDYMTNGSSASIPRAQRYSLGSKFTDVEATPSSATSKKRIVVNSMSQIAERCSVRWVDPALC